LRALGGVDQDFSTFGSQSVNVSPADQSQLAIANQDESAATK
jgi:hypothetical protein